MEGRFEFMQHFIALGFIKLDSWVLSRRKPMSWDRLCQTGPIRNS